SPPHRVKNDGWEPLKVATRLGIVYLARQVCSQRDTQRHVLPGNALLPAHRGMLISRALQEWVCLRPQDLPFESATRLLSWLTGEGQVLCTSEVRRLVCKHGNRLREAEEALLQEVLEARETGVDPPRRTLPWVPATTPR